MTSDTATPAHQHAYDELKRAIMAGDYPPGTTFSIQSIADQFDFGMMPVREALKRLSAEGAIEVSPKRAMRIPTLDKQSIADVCRMRSILEGEAAARAADNMTAPIITHLKTLDAQMETALDKGDGRQFRRSNQEFHFSIYNAADAYMMTPVIEMLWLQIGPLQANYTKENYLIGRGVHAHIVAALERADARLARAAMESDIASATDVFLKFFD
ncbi:MAG: GntR family transcriptional regulator [Pseudomonadota bacterium]